MSLATDNTKRQEMMFEMVERIRRDDGEYLRLKDFVKGRIRDNVETITES
jgi:hypothetical protein